MTAARKLAAILEADVVGYSRLMGEDEADTAKAVREHREAASPIIASLSGRLVKTMGDGLLLEFPSVVAAVECAIAIQKLMVERNADTPENKRIVYRIGVNLGDVLIDGDDILGDGVNVAARLEGISEPGGICVSSAAYEQVRDKIAASFTDLGDQQLKNIARPVRVYRVDSATSSGSPRAALPPTNNPSIAVLPFANMSGDPEQEYFADGVVEDIIIGLSRIKWLFVIARNSSFAHKGKAVDVKKVGRELGVRYLLEGSVRRAGARVRLSGRVVETEGGIQVWAQRYDRTAEDIFALQDDITMSVVAAIDPSLRRAEIERVKRKRPDSLDAYDLVLRALAEAPRRPLDARCCTGRADVSRSSAHA